ncbi:MAG: alkaline phosphatase family protein [Actinomycetota bacterium]
MSLSRALPVALALALVGAACSSVATGQTSTTPATSSPPASGSASASPSASVVETNRALATRVCANVSHEVLLRTWHGYMRGRSGDIQIIPTYPNFVNGGLTHATPYPYTQDVPLFLYGPGYVKSGVYPRAATLADIAPTTGAFLKFPFDAPDGRAQSEALVPASQRPLPRLVVTLVWDSGGMDVLDRWKNDWPYLHSLLPHGAWFTHVTVGSSPSNTPTGHSIIGTGAFPQHNGFVDEYIRVNGRIQKPNENGPQFLVAPTLADLYDLAQGNKPIVGGIATLSAHIMMMGHGSGWGGGDRDIVVTREQTHASTAGAEATAWNLTPDMAPFYTFPKYVNDLPPISAYTQQLDQADGKIDGNWRQNSIAQLSNGFDTPARTPYQTKLIETVIQREGFGKDDVPDLLFLNYKAIDTIGHLFSADSPEMSDALKYQDEALQQFVGFLNRVVGKGKWVMLLTADHGTQRDPTVSGAFMIDINKLTSLLQKQFDDDNDKVALFEKIRPTEIWVNPVELQDNGVTLTQISTFITSLTQEQTYKNANVPAAGHEQDTVFDAAFPSSMLSALPCLPEARAH